MKVNNKVHAQSHAVRWTQTYDQEV